MGDMSSSPAREAFHRAFYTDGTVDAEDIGGGWAKDVLGAWGADVPLVGLRNDVKGASQGAMTRGTTNGAALMLKGMLGGRGGPTLRSSRRDGERGEGEEGAQGGEETGTRASQKLAQAKAADGRTERTRKVAFQKARMKMTADQKRAEAINKTQRRANLKQKNETLAAAAVLANALGTEKSTSVA